MPVGGAWERRSSSCSTDLLFGDDAAALHRKEDLHLLTQPPSRGRWSQDSEPLAGVQLHLEVPSLAQVSRANHAAGEAVATTVGRLFQQDLVRADADDVLTRAHGRLPPPTVRARRQGRWCGL